MKAILILCCFSLSLVACQGPTANPQPEILGVSLGMTKDEAHKRLGEIGRLEKEERKQQEVWSLRDNPEYSHLIVSYDKEYKGLRFVTAVAKEGGRPVRYDEVIDTAKARREGAGDTVTYTLKLPVEGGSPAYVAKAIGSGPEYLKYYSVEKVDQ